MVLSSTNTPPRRDRPPKARGEGFYQSPRPPQGRGRAMIGRPVAAQGSGPPSIHATPGRRAPAGRPSLAPARAPRPGPRPSPRPAPVAPARPLLASVTGAPAARPGLRNATPTDAAGRVWTRLAARLPAPVARAPAVRRGSSGRGEDRGPAPPEARPCTRPRVRAPRAFGDAARAPSPAPDVPDAARRKEREEGIRFPEP